MSRCRRLEKIAAVIEAKKWRFTRAMVADAPAHPGIYALWQGEQLLKVGIARRHETIRAKLLAQFEVHGTTATHYSWEIARSPEQRAREIVHLLGDAH